MYLTPYEISQAEEVGRRHGETRDGLYDSTPPSYLQPEPLKAQEWRNAYAVAYTEARHKRGL